VLVVPHERKRAKTALGDRVETFADGTAAATTTASATASSSAPRTSPAR
jgi:hypothetical protein